MVQLEHRSKPELHRDIGRGKAQPEQQRCPQPRSLRVRLSRGGMIPEQSARRGTQKTYVPQGKCPQMRKDMKPQQIRERWRNSTAVVDDFRIARKLQSGIPRIRLKIVNSPTLGPVHLYC